MQLVVFAVVLILPSFLSGESFLTITEISNECEGAIVEGGDLKCTAKESHYSGYDPVKCAVVCEDGTEVKVPYGVCSNNQLKVCTSEVVKRELKRVGRWKCNKKRVYKTFFTLI
uniref:Putative secreted protein n=1 Tax=Ixodes ricinus TaxID=34613 RepID=V5H047_IXORI